MAYKVRFRPDAEVDLFALYNYIAQASGHKRAGDYVSRIEATCLSLATFPLRGVPRDDLETGLRTIAFERRATIIFRVEADVVRILRVFYAGRDFEALYRTRDDGED